MKLKILNLQTALADLTLMDLEMENVSNSISLFLMGILRGNGQNDISKYQNL